MEEKPIIKKKKLTSCFDGSIYAKRGNFKEKDDIDKT